MVTMDIKNYYCQTCAISTPRLDVETGRVCRRDGSPVKDDHFCGYHTRSLKTCECCGQPYIGSGYILMNMKDDEAAIIDAVICPNCNKQFGTCRTCQNGNLCTFETDPSPLPKIVQKQIRQGNMTAVTQVMNPERVAITCQKGCPCYSPDFSCSKQNHEACQQYHMNRV